MVADLCCATEQDSRSSSPELPNARVTQATPARQPLLPKNTTSPNSRYTSVGSEDLRELRNIFDHARDSESDQQSKAKPPAAHKHFHRPSMISLRSIHNVASMRSILRRPFSKQALAQKPLLGQPQVDLKTLTTTPDTVVKQPGFEHKGDLFNKDALKKHLLSDKKPDEGGYDFDAEVLEDMAKNLGKKASGKRPSIHSIEWSPSTGRYVSSQSDLQDTFMDVSQSKSTPVSSTKDRHSAGPKRDITPYDVEKSQMSSMSLRLSHIFSAPILRPDKSPVNKGKLKHSASMVSSSVVLSTPCRLPTLPTTDTDGIPWAERINESLRLSQCSVTSPLPGTEASETRVAVAENTKKDMRNDVRNQSANHTTLTEPGSPLPVIKLDLKLHRTTHRASLQDITFGNSAPDVREHIAKGEEDENSDDPRRSVHLHNMRISHHLRSGSLLSWDQFSNTSELPSPCTIRERAVSDQSRVHQARNARHERQTSSSGFGSSKVPSRWGIVLAYDRDYAGDVASSIYSSRPQSPPDSLANLSYACVGHTTFSMSSMDSRKHRRSMSLPLDSDRTPRALDGQDHSTPVPESKAPSFPDLTFDSPGRTKSVSETKRSKFQEEFTSSPSKRKLTSSTSLMRLLDPRRLSLRSHDDAHQSESGTKLIKESSNSRRQSRSSNQTKNEREGSVASKGVDDVWDQALKAYQKEKASMFFPENQSQALTGSLYRDRRASLTAKRSSVATIEHTDQQRNPSIALSSPSPGTTRPEYFTDISSRRDALTRSDGANATQDISNAFNKQGDSTKVVGAWGRYPSHNRDDRNVACKVDHVDTRDFALESTLGSMSTWGGQHDADMVDPLESPDRTHTKRKGTGFIKKSQTMTFGKQFLKNYSRIFKSQSVEFRKHGQGHRSSIASSGVLEYPELELLPEPWNERSRIRRSSRLGLFDGEDSTSTLRPPMHPSRRSSAPDMSELYSNDSVFDSEPGQDRARFWSVYYENCVPTFPRMSSDLNNVFDGLEEQVRDSADSRVTVVPGAWPNTSPSHPLNTEAEDPDHAPPRRSSLPRPAFPPNYKLDAQPNPGNVRRSTLDLISQFKEQEKEEHEKILALARSKSQSQPNVS